MKKQWKNHNINLQQLTEKIQNHYTQKGLKTKTKPLPNGTRIYLILTDQKIPGIMTITINGKPNNFTIETKASEYEDDAVKIGLSTTLFGGGYLVFSSAKIREELEKQENNFWTNIEETIATLTNTTAKQNQNNTQTTKNTN